MNRNKNRTETHTSKQTTASINHTRHSICNYSLDGAARARKQTSDYSLAYYPVYRPRKGE